MDNPTIQATASNIGMIDFIIDAIDAYTSGYRLGAPTQQDHALCDFDNSLRQSQDDYYRAQAQA